jgi:GH35 family endo-1,4-beta-xylanase
MIKKYVMSIALIAFVIPAVAANDWFSVLDEADLTFGVAVEPRYLDDSRYVEKLLANFNAISPENAGKWERIHPKQDEYDFEGMDKIVDFSLEHGLDVRGHTLVWHNQNPNWFTSGLWTAYEAKQILLNHIDTVVGRYKGKIKRWDVVNEALADNGDLRGTYWYYVLEEEYLAMAFEQSHRADPEAILYYNDYGISDCGDKADGAYQLMSKLVEQGVPVHGIGFQGHYEVSNPVDLHCLNDNINRMGALGLEVQITELDIRVNMADFDEIEADKQTKQYRDMMGLLASNSHLNGITIWGLSDAHSWIPSWFTGQGSALLFNDALEEKPVLDSVKGSLTAFLLETELFELPVRRELTLRSFPVFGADELPEALSSTTIAKSDTWQAVESYPLAFNQLKPLRMAIDSSNDIHATWQVAYHGTSLYGRLNRQDDVTVPVNSNAIWENDCVEIFVKWAGKLYQFRAQIGEDFADIGFPGKARAQWSDTGEDLYFIIEFPNITELKGQTLAWNIALADVDVEGGTREAQLYPVPGSNKSWVGKDLAELHFTAQNRPPSQDAKGVVAAIDAAYSQSSELPAQTRRIPQLPLSFGSNRLKVYPTVMFTWQDQGFSAHIQTPEGLHLTSTQFSLRALDKVLETSAFGETVALEMEASPTENQFYRASLEVTVQDLLGNQYQLSLAPQNGFFDLRTQ